MPIIPGSPGGDPNDKGSDIGNDISVDNIKEEKGKKTVILIDFYI